MSFRAWFYLCKLAAACFPLFVLGWFGHPYLPELKASASSATSRTRSSTIGR